MFWVIGMGINQSTDNEFKDRLRGDSTFDKMCEYFGLPYQTHKNINYAGDVTGRYKIYTTWYVPIMPFLLIFAPVKFFYKLLIGNAIAAHKEKQYQQKILINLADIYSFKEGDKIRLKNDAIIEMRNFSPRGFSDSEKNIYSWNQAKENETAAKRKQINTKNINFEIFAKEAAEFKTKADEFKKQMEIQETELLKQYHVEKVR
jgi:hypothetical protein